MTNLLKFIRSCDDPRNGAEAGPEQPSKDEPDAALQRETPRAPVAPLPSPESDTIDAPLILPAPPSSLRVTDEAEDL